MVNALLTADGQQQLGQIVTWVCLYALLSVHGSVCKLPSCNLAGLVRGSGRVRWTAIWIGDRYD